MFAKISGDGLQAQYSWRFRSCVRDRRREAQHRYSKVQPVKRRRGDEEAERFARKAEPGL
jgi:hypothetical protein